MKARARLLLLLIGMMSFTGFSTTSDLNQDSDTVTISDHEVGDIVTAVIVVKSDLNMVQTQFDLIDVGKLNVSQMFLLNYTAVLDAELKAPIKPPLICFSGKNKTTTKLLLPENRKEVFSNRRARDSINCQMS